MQDTAQDARFVADLNADVTVEKIAEVYAKAYLDAVAGENQSTESAVEEFASFIGILKTQHQFAEVLASAMVSIEEKVSLLKSAVANQASPLFWNFLQTVARRHRLDIIGAIYFQVQAIYAKICKRIPVTITAASEVDDDLRNSLADKMRGILGGEPVITTVVDPSIIAGLVVRVGDTVYDASVQTQLEAARRSMVEHSAKEIQSGRERYLDNAY
jgi:F-type H+-transporting ATPase subunit delta